jgi:hypothetical protein
LVASAPEFSERTLTVGGIGKAVGHAPKFHQGAEAFNIGERHAV